ncbi:hypothetical protein FQR65_LT09596 [Abscondita terminalis]|nr:hypothetical protein FQR65_LT09596 [Abscondita terminalis]
MENTCVITKVQCSEDSVKPIIVNFENGTIESGKEKNLVCRLYKNLKNDKHIAAATDNMLYKGIIQPKDLYNTFIGVCNKKRTKMRLIAADHATLSPYFRDDGTSNDSFALLNATTSELNKQFGSKKVKRQTEQHERMKADIETVKKQLEQTVQDIKIENEDMVFSKGDESSSSYKPPINKDATSPRDIYNIHDIVSEEVLSSLTKEAERIRSEPNEEIDTVNFVKQQIKKLRNANLNKTNMKLELLLYVDCLIKFMWKQAKELNLKTLKLCTYSKIVQDDILKQFTIVSGKNRLRPNLMRDKCTCSILVLSMIVCEYELNLDLIAKELKIGLKKVQDISRALSFHVNRDIATLSLPLPSPFVSRLNSKKRKR